MKLSQEGETLLANIGSLTDQLKQLQEGEEFSQDPELADLEPEEETGADLEAIFAKLVDGEPLLSEELEALGEATAGSGELVEDLVVKLASGEPLTGEEVELLKAALEGGGAEEVEAGEAIAKAIIQRSLAGVGRQDAVPLLSGIAGLNRAGRLVRKRFGSWAEAREDTSPADADLVRLFGGGDSRVSKALPTSLEPEDEEEDEVLRRAVSKMQTGKALTEEEMAEALAANLKGQPFAALAGVTLSGGIAHKALIPFNRTRPVESLQETVREVKAMISNEREDIILNRQGRGGKRKDLVRKSLGAAVNAILGQRQ